MFNVVLVNPDIPHNTGAIGRLCLATQSTLHLVKPLGFDLTEKAVRRAGLDYWKDVDLKVWDSLDELMNQITTENFHLLTTKTEKTYWQAKFQKSDYLIFGSETKGLPESLIDRFQDHTLTIPMDKTNVRSLNLATAAGIIIYDGARQLAIGQT